MRLLYVSDLQSTEDIEFEINLEMRITLFEKGTVPSQRTTTILVIELEDQTRHVE